MDNVSFGNLLKTKHIDIYLTDFELFLEPHSFFTSGHGNSIQVK